MGKDKKRKHSRSHSRERERSKDQSGEKMQKMQKQLDNLSMQMLAFMQAQQALIPPPPSQSSETPEIIEIKDKEKSTLMVNVESSELDRAEELLPPELLDIRGEDPSKPKEVPITFNAAIKVRMEKWLQEGLQEDVKKSILEKYPKKGELRLETPKINVEIRAALSEIAKKRDVHFVNSQNSAGSALSALGAAMSMVVDNPEDGIDQELLVSYLWDASKLMCDVFHQFSVARRSFITPLLNKSVKPTVEATKPDEWLYGEKFAEQIKEAKTVENACANIKAPEKPSITANKGQGNVRHPPARYKQNIHADIPPCELQDVINVESNDDNKEIDEVIIPAGRLRLFTDVWREITTDKFIIQCLQGYKIPFRKIPHQFKPPNAPSRLAKNWTTISAEIEKLLIKGAIEECSEEEGQFISSYFLIPKPDGSNRFIFNLKRLNRFVAQKHFKMEDIRSVKILLNQGDWMASLDLKDAYFLMPVHRDHRKYLRFQFNGKLFQFTCLPFGLCSSPYVYTKIFKPVMYKLRIQGIRTVIYIDDLIIIANSYSKCSNQVKIARDLIERLGFIINYQKSSLIPNQRCRYLGFIINSIDYRLELTDKKKEQISTLCGELQIGISCQIREFAKLLGILTAACHAVAYGSIHCKHLERKKFLALLRNDYNYEGEMIIEESMMKDLNWWERNSLIGFNPIRTNDFQIEIFSDASLTGWGAHCEGVSSHGFWSIKNKKFSINYLELLAVFHGLKCFASRLSNCEILLRVDNATAISYVNRTGGVQFPHLSNLAREIWSWCESKNLWVFASYIASEENVEADRASRILNIDTEWELNKKIFKEISQKFGPFSIDLFASESNRKCDRFCSRFPSPGTCTVDAFTIPWRTERGYCSSTGLAHATVVPAVHVPSNISTFDNETREKSITLTLQGEDPSASTETLFDGRSFIRRAFLNKGVDEEAAEILVDSLASSTIKQYQSALRPWRDFSLKNNINPYKSSSTDIIKFLFEKFQNGASYTGLNTTRSAISLISSEDIHTDGLISRFLKGIYRKKPSRPRYASTWDPAPVLDYLKNLKPLVDLSLREATEKVVTLMALTTAHRLQTLAAININNIEYSDSGIKIKIPDLLKTSKAKSFQPELVLPVFKAKPELCVGSLIKEYLKITNEFRPENNKNLFICTRKPYEKASTDTLSHWIKSTLNKAGVDTTQFTAYSTRHASVSAAYRGGVSIDTIRRTVGWSKNSQVFAKFYNKPLTNTEDFALSILNT
ncbi:uncharacterized protein LOC135163921 [Diachasmimorpha longicaudata]|uniref:uncharacterized protein LOC135163921 n=1 Tax=Diachasmimorpha longicaudata TaxID=58733 RepID=UPI0030B8CB2E